MLAHDREDLTRLCEESCRGGGFVAELDPIHSAVQCQRHRAYKLPRLLARFGDEVQLVRMCGRCQGTLPSAGMTQIRFLGYEDSVRLVLSPKAPPAFVQLSDR